MSAKSNFPILPLVILVIGLISVIIVFLVLSSPNIRGEPVDSIQEAKEIAKGYLDRNYQGLEIEEIMEFENNFYVIITEIDTGIGAFELLVDPVSGRIVREPGPNLMWNTKYGHHRISNPNVDMPITEEVAEDIAQNWLDRNISGSKVEETEVFYGYYTIDFQREGEIFGMMSVNGFDGDVWYHSWHGDFISMEEYN